MNNAWSKTRLIALGCLMLVMAGCAWLDPNHASIEWLTDTEYNPRDPNFPISLTYNDFEEPYAPIAVVTTQPYADQVARELGEAELKRIAREIGGDAVVRVSLEGRITEEFGYHPSTRSRYGTQYRNRTALTGVVVRFKR